MCSYAIRSCAIIGAMIFLMAATPCSVAQSSPVSVVVAEAKLARFMEQAEALGTLKANESVELTVNVAETISAIYFDDGQSVRKGDVLVEMMSTEETALLEEARTNMREAKRQLDRVQQLVDVGNASEALLDQRQRDYDSARARLAATESRLKDRVVKAPFSGGLGLRNVSVGALVQPGDLISTLTDDNKMKLDFTVPSLFLPVLSVGLPVNAKTRAYPEMTFEGTVSSIDNQINPVTRAITVRAILPNDKRLLKQGMLMTINVFMNARESVVIPEESLLPQGDDNFVMVAVPTEGEEAEPNGFVAERRQVIIARRRVGEVEIKSGLAAGEKVITHGAFKLKPGSAVQLSNDDLTVN